MKKAKRMAKKDIKAGKQGVIENFFDHSGESISMLKGKKDNFSVLASLQ